MTWFSRKDPVVTDIRALDHLQVLHLMTSMTSATRHRFVLRMLGDKEFRPASIEEQFRLLRGIATDQGFPLGVRSTANIAAAHKAMELLHDEKAREMVSIIEDELPAVGALKYGSVIREDRVHLTFSALSVLFHLHLFLGEREKFFEVGRVAQRTAAVLNCNELRRSFLVTSTNIARCLAVAALAEFVERDTGRLSETRDLVERVFFVGYSKGALRQLLKHEIWPTFRNQLSSWTPGQVATGRLLSDEVPSVAFREYSHNMRILHLIGDAVHGAPVERDLLEAAVRPRNAETAVRMARTYEGWKQA